MSAINKTRAIRQYENAIMHGGNHTSLKGDDEEKHKLACAVLRYAFTELLGWDATDVREHLTYSLFCQMKLDMFERYIDFPPDVDRHTDMDYYAYLAFPETGYDNSAQVLRAYHRILSGDDPGFRKNFFRGPNGYLKVSIMLRDFIASSIPANSTADLYQLFADTKTIAAKLRKAKLYTTVMRLYDSPLDCLHYSLTDDEQDEFLYNFYSYVLAYGYAKPKRKSKKRTGTTEK